MKNQKPPTEHDLIVRHKRKTRPTAVCGAAAHPNPPTQLKIAWLPLAGAIGAVAHSRYIALLPAVEKLAIKRLRSLRFEPLGEAIVEAVRTGALALRAGRHAPGTGFELCGLTGEPSPQLELRIRAIYAVDEGASPQWSLDHVRDAVSALVEACNRDLLGTGFRYISFVRHDVEVRNDRLLAREVDLSEKDLDNLNSALASGQIGETEGMAVINSAIGRVGEHRNKVASERPNTLCWIFSRGNGIGEERDDHGILLRWNYIHDRGNSWSGGNVDFVALHEGFLETIDGARQDASRAVHEVGHYLGLWHTHRGPFHDPVDLVREINSNPDFAKILNIDPDELDDKKPSNVRFAAWKRAVCNWLDKELADGASSEQAEIKYDVDRDGGITDTPADPGASIMALANEAAGHGWDELGPVTTISLDVPNVYGSVDLTPLRDNPMGYYLRETPEAMTFTGLQVNVMRNFLINGGRRPLVAAQLGDTATPDLRVCAAWSPSSNAQRVIWGWSPEDHAAEHERMRQSGMVMIHQQAYTRNNIVLFDGIWDPGNRPQEIIWGWLDEHVRADVNSRAARGMSPVAIQAYQHLDHGIRYNVIYEPGSGDSRVLLGVTQDELSEAWNIWMPKGYRMTQPTFSVGSYTPYGATFPSSGS